jgi:hypothetical protein
LVAGSVHTLACGEEARPVTSMPAVMSWASIRRSARMSRIGSDTGPFDHTRWPRLIRSFCP